ncbi:hypothetical protein BH10PSE11_BH10PSE11_05990 [soil metagenome]
MSTAWECIQAVPHGVWWTIAVAVGIGLAWNARNAVKKINTAVQTGAPTIAVVGDDTNIDLVLESKGTGLVRASDAAFALTDNGNATKKLQFQLSGIAIATTRTLTAPNASGRLALLGLAQTWTDNQRVNGVLHAARNYLEF